MVETNEQIFRFQLFNKILTRWRQAVSVQLLGRRNNPLSFFHYSLLLQEKKYVSSFIIPLSPLSLSFLSLSLSPSPLSLSLSPVFTTSVFLAEHLFSRSIHCRRRCCRLQEMFFFPNTIVCFCVTEFLSGYSSFFVTAVVKFRSWPLSRCSNSNNSNNSSNGSSSNNSSGGSDLPSQESSNLYDHFCSNNFSRKEEKSI